MADIDFQPLNSGDIDFQPIGDSVPTSGVPKSTNTAGGPPGAIAEEKIDTSGLTGPFKVAGNTVLKALSAGHNMVGAPLERMVLNALPGPDVPDWNGLGRTFNPTTLSNAPGASEMMAQKGIGPLGHLSDMIDSPYRMIPRIGNSLVDAGVLPKYAEPSKNNPWYVPEKGGAFDPSGRGTIGLAADVLTDPASYVTAGASALKNLGNEGSATLKALGQVAGDVTPDIMSKMGELSGKIPGLTSLSQAPSKVLQALGEYLYGGRLSDVEHEGETFNKSGVADTLYKMGVKTPMDLPGIKDTVAQKLVPARNAILDEATEAGARGDVSKAVAPAKQVIMSAGEPGPFSKMMAQKTVEPAQNLIDEIEQMGKGSPPIPEIPPKTVTETIRGSMGEPVQRDIVIPGQPGKPGVPAQPLTPRDASATKTRITSDLVGSPAYSEFSKTPLGKQVFKALASGFNSQELEPVGETLGADAMNNVAELNKDMGNTLGTMKSQNAAAKLYNRQMSNMAPSRTDALLMALGFGHGGPEEAGKMLMFRKALDATNLAQMPAGYYMRAAGEQIAPLIDVGSRQLLNNPWGIQNGQK